VFYFEYTKHFAASSVSSDLWRYTNAVIIIILQYHGMLESTFDLIDNI